MSIRGLAGCEGQRAWTCRALPVHHTQLDDARERNMIQFCPQSKATLERKAGTGRGEQRAASTANGRAGAGKEEERHRPTKRRERSAARQTRERREGGRIGGRAHEVREAGERKRINRACAIEDEYSRWHGCELLLTISAGRGGRTERMEGHRRRDRGGRVTCALP